jgi:protein phosphatase
MNYAWGITDKGVVRSQNQDSYYLKSAGDGLVAAMVCDGMGGARAGNVASSLAVETASAYLEELSWEALLQDPGGHLSQAAALANEAVCYRAEQDPECRGMGTTMVAVIHSGQKAYILNIGDSRAYLLGEEGVVKITRDHSVVEDLVQRGELTPEEARSHPQKNLITRALGAEPEARTDLYEVELKSGEFLLLCSDGLSNLLTDQELLYEVLYGGTPESCCQRMLDIALSRGAPDNVTVVLIQQM